jgi:hypothetical protein
MSDRAALHAARRKSPRSVHLQKFRKSPGKGTGGLLSSGWAFVDAFLN